MIDQVVAAVESCGSARRRVLEALTPHLIPPLSLLAPFPPSRQESNVLDVFLRDGAKVWARAGPSSGFTVAAPGGMGETVAAQVAAGTHRRLSDFDDHLDDITRDWTNKGLLK
jgi:hypothetical protein